MGETKMKQLRARIPEELLNILDLDAKIQGIKRSELVRQILLEHYRARSIFTTELKEKLAEEVSE